MVRRPIALPDLFAWQPPQVAAACPEDVTGRGALGNRIARLVGRALREAADNGHDRKAVAATISRTLARPVSPDMLNKWASEASDEHRIPFDAFIALVEATDYRDALGFMPEMFGYAVVPEKYAGIIELHLIEEHEAEIAARKSAVLNRLKVRR
jgi:hypothetical protein